MILWLLRHGKAADAITYRGGDADRPLTERGEAQAEEAGETLARHAPQIDFVLTSPRTRALQTAELAVEAHGAAPEPEVVDFLGGDYGLADLLGRLEVLDMVRMVDPWTDWSGHVVVVGHNPTLSILLHELTGEDKGLSTGALAGIDLSTRELVARARPQA